MASDTTSSDSPYPVQRHAGKVGYGPNYNAGAGLSDKLTGLAEEIKGKITHNPELVRHGHELFTGEAKRRELLGTGEKDPVFEGGNNAAKKKPDGASIATGAEKLTGGNSVRVVSQSQ